jgi:DNA-binding CsgD family transcriptional regulator
VFVNRTADQILCEGKGLDWSQEGFTGPSASHTQEIRQFLTGRDSRSYLLPLPGKKDRLVLRVLPLDWESSNLPINPQGDRAKLAVIMRHPQIELKKNAESAAAMFGLTPRETDVVELLVRGLNVPAIAAELKISVGNVRIHLKRVFAKTDTHSQTDLVRIFFNLQA